MTPSSSGDSDPQDFYTQIFFRQNLLQVAVLLISSGLIGFVIAHLQDQGGLGLFQLGHSLSIWVVIAVVASLNGTFHQGSWLAIGCLAIGVVVYYWTSAYYPWNSGAAHSGLVVQRPFSVVLVGIWLVGALVAGSLFAVLTRAALRANKLGALSAGVIAGLLCGDLLVARSGFIWDGASSEYFARAVSPFTSLNWLDTAALAVILIWAFVSFNYRLRLLLLLIPGAVVGCVVASLPLFAIRSLGGI